MITRNGIVLFTLFLCISSYAQQLGQFIDKSQEIFIPFTISLYGTKHGLPQNQVIDITPKPNGNLILSTANGIVEYNGYEFFDVVANPVYKKEAFAELYWDATNQQLVGNRFSPTCAIISSALKELTQFTSVYYYQNNLYGITSDGVIKKRKGKSNNFETFASTNIKSAWKFRIIAGNIYINGKDGTYCYNIVQQQTKKLISETFVEIERNTTTKTNYLITYQHVYKFSDFQKPTLVTLQPDNKDYQYTDITLLPDDEVMITSTNGLFYLAEWGLETYNKKSYFPSQSLHSIYYDEKQECLFIGSSEKGLLKLQMKNCSTFFESPGIGDAALSSMIRTTKGQVLAVGSNQTIYSISIDGNSVFHKSPHLLSTISECNNKLYIGTWGKGVFELKGNKYVDSTRNGQLNNGYIHCIFQDKRKNLWIGTDEGVSLGKEIKSLRPFAKKSIHGQIICAFERKNGDIYFGGKEGIFVVNRKNQFVRHIGLKEGLICKEVRSFYEDKQGKLWIGTYDGGVYCLEGNKLTSINLMSNCKLIQDAFTLAKDSQGMIYMTTNQGLYLIQEEKLNAFYRGKINYLVPFYYGEELGILNTEFNGGFQNNYVSSKYDHFYFPTIQGAVVVTPSYPTFRKLKPAFKSISVNDTLIPNNFSVFERSTHTIQFEFYCPNYSGKFNVHYQYQLIGNGLPSDWSNLQRDGTVIFKMLPPGSYVFKVRAIDGFNDSNPETLLYAFEIKPYLTESWWFRISIFIIFALFIGGYIRNRVRTQRNKEAKEHVINSAMLELKLKAIQAKMNPHFIFNSLNNIQYLIVLGKKEEAETALSEFSSLLRKFLQQSDKSFNRLCEEIHILELYISIEQFRFDGELDVTFDIATDTMQAVLPTMLLQPVVENAIKHGLSHKEKLRKLTVKSIRDVNNAIVLTVEDNGIGRDASRKINAYREDHISHGLHLVEDKIRMLQEKYGIVIESFIFDNEAPNTGTIVIFKIPFIHDTLLDN